MDILLCAGACVVPVHALRKVFPGKMLRHGNTLIIIIPTSEVNMGYYFRSCEPLDPDLEESNSSTWHSICLRYIRMLCLAVKDKAIQKTHLSRTRTIAEGSPTLTSVHMP